MSEIRTYTPVRGMLVCENGTGDYVLKAEAEERHEKQLQELRDKAVEAVNTALCYYGCSKGKYCEEPCERRNLIIQKLNEK